MGLLEDAELEVRKLIASCRTVLADGSLSITEVGEIVREFLHGALVLAESAEGLTGPQKKQFVIDAVLRLWDDCLEPINIPVVPDKYFDPWIRGQLPLFAGWIVDLLVSRFNKVGWPV